MTGLGLHCLSSGFGAAFPAPQSELALVGSAWAELELCLLPAPSASFLVTPTSISGMHQAFILPAYEKMQQNMDFPLQTSRVPARGCLGWCGVEFRGQGIHMHVAARQYIG